MQVAVDCRGIHPHMGGIGRAALELVRAMGARPRGHTITMIVSSARVGSLALSGVRILPVDGAMIDERFDQLHLPSILKQIGADVYLNTTFSVPAVKTTTVQISVIHDVVFEDKPAFVEPGLRQFLGKWSRFAAAHADHVLTDSDYSRERILRVYGVAPDKVSRVYLGIAPACFEPPYPADLERVRQKFSLRGPYLLYLGSIEIKKGILELLAAYRRASDAGLREPLVLAGGIGGPDGDIEARIRERGLSNKVRLLGFIDEEDKKALLAASTLFLYPSLYEGFGFPPLEAMALGVPCLVSDRTSLPEVVGDAALIARVEDAGDFSEKVLRGVSDPAFRRAAAAKGPERARGFTWDRTSEEVLDLCERLGGD